MIVIVLGSLFTLIVGMTSVVGETHQISCHAETGRVTRKLTRLGWVAVIFLVLGAITTIFASYQQWRSGQEADRVATETLDSAQAIFYQNNAVLIQTQKIAVQTWKDSRDIEGVEGYATLSLDLEQIDLSSDLQGWLQKVSVSFRQQETEYRLLHEHRKFGGYYVAIDEHSNSNLFPNNTSEGDIKKFIFNANIAVFVTKGKEPGLMVPSFWFEMEADSARVYYSVETEEPVGIEMSLRGVGRFNPIRGQLSNWLDLYGQHIIVRIMRTNDTVFENLAVNYFTVDTSNTKWNASARFPLHEETVYQDEDGSLVVLDADWNTLGHVPPDYPGERLSIFGPAPEAQ